MAANFVHGLYKFCRCTGLCMNLRIVSYCGNSGRIVYVSGLIQIREVRNENLRTSKQNSVPSFFFSLIIELYPSSASAMDNLITTIATLTVDKREDMPSATTAMPSLSSSSETYTTPSITVPPNHDNPYILHSNATSGTVFIAVGTVVGAILLAFILFHLIKSIRASSLAKKEMFGDKHMYEKYQNNNNNAYGLTPSTTLNLNSEFQPVVSKLPLFSHHPSKSVISMGGSQFGGDTSTIFASETGQQPHDMTKMFISPTAEAMNSIKGGKNPSVANLSLVVASTTNLSNPVPATNRHSQLIPSLYLNTEINNSEYSMGPASPPATESRAPNRGKTPIPSMYLEDLMDDYPNTGSR